MFEAALAVIAAGSAARDLGVRDEALSRLIQARDKLAHVYRIDEIVPGYLDSLIRTRVRPAVERARELLEGLPERLIDQLESRVGGRQLVPWTSTELLPDFYRTGRNAVELAGTVQQVDE